MFANATEAVDFIKNEDIQLLDIRFTDLLGSTQHFTVSAAGLTADELSAGYMFDGSSITGFTEIHKSDMRLLPDFSSSFVDPFRSTPTLNMNFAVVDGETNKGYGRDPRMVAKRAEAYLRSTGIADTVSFGAEAEFYLFDDVRYSTTTNASSFLVDSSEGAWNSNREEEGGNSGYKIPVRGGYFPVPPTDASTEVRDFMCATLEKVGLIVERAHHEVGTGGQQEINYRYAPLLTAADDMMKFKYVVRMCADEAGMTATFMPKPLAGDNGSGMHCHQSLWKDGQPIFADPAGYAGLSEAARFYIGGLIKHAPSLAAFTNPTTNSYRRLVPGFEAPVNLVYSSGNRSACIRIPRAGDAPAAKRVEYRVPDPTANPYLAFSAQLMAGLDGILNRIEPPAPVDKNLYSLPAEELAQIGKMPGSLEEALNALAEDHAYLTAGNVFSEDLISTWIQLKMDREVTPLRALPHPYEFNLYYKY
ncbi:type I glutamate--ammonia ligase [Neoactinobaculum massilliense]|uniref:type I glutamate--ammonia ligase n=1 Tax=Neoactinobaculum massilliense TaxID=2364794 RepID=UPI000F539742|nr:type I glutamate--ammonia ligase [Neoactinobaculum massilliense]